MESKIQVLVLKILKAYEYENILVGLVGLWCLTSLSTIFQLYRGGQFYWWRKPEYPEQTTDPSNIMYQLINRKKNYWIDNTCSTCLDNMNDLTSLWKTSFVGSIRLYMYMYIVCTYKYNINILIKYIAVNILMKMTHIGKR